MQDLVLNRNEAYVMVFLTTVQYHEDAMLKSGIHVSLSVSRKLYAKSIDFQQESS